MEPHDGLKVFAARISNGPMGLARLQPEPSAQKTRCFQNVIEKVKRDGGRICFGWYFQYKISLEHGPYLVATHHAVWHAPGGHLIDVTPLHEDENCRPITERDGVIFLVDQMASPVTNDRMIAPLPMKYFPLSDEEKTLRYVEKMQHEEEERCRDLYKNDPGEPSQDNED